MRQESPVIRSSGQLIRDYIYIEDAVDAYMQLSAALTSDKTLRGEAFNFSNESVHFPGRTIRHVIIRMHLKGRDHWRC